MPTYEVNAPDGQKYRVNAPSGASEQDAIQYVQTQFYSPKTVDMSSGFGQKLNEGIADIPRQIGLTARHGIEGIGDTLDTLASPFRSGLNAMLPNRSPTLSGLVTGEGGGPAIQGRTGQSVADLIGLPVPQTQIEKIAAEPTKLLSGGGLLLKGAQLASSLPGITGNVASLLATNPAQQLQAATGAGLADGYVKETGGDPLAQGAAAFAGGVAAPTAINATRAIPQSIKGAIEYLAPGLTQKSFDLQVDIIIGGLLKDSGLKISDLTASVANQLRQDVTSALKTGDNLSPDAMRRLADYRMVGAVPRRGNLTLDVGDLTREKNAAKFGANSADPKLQELAQIENSNAKTIISGLNSLGAGSGVDNYSAAGRVINSLDSLNTSQKNGINAAYRAARDAAGRDITLDGQSFVLDAYDRLAKSNKGAFLPAEIQKLLENIRTGKQTFGGKAVPVNFSIDAIDNLKTTLSNAAMSRDGNVRAAVGLVRQALDDVQPISTGRAVGGNQLIVPDSLNVAQNQANELGANALSLFDKARAENKSWMNIVDKVPALQAVRDGVEPDKFVSQFIIGNGSAASVMDVAKLKSLLQNDPQAISSIRSQMLDFIKSKALNNAPDEAATLSQSALNKAIDAIGERKLRLFFDQGELAQIKALGRVALYEQVQPRGSAVNNSNTAGAALAAVFDKLANAPIIGKIPFAPQMAGSLSASLTARRSLNAPKSVVLPQPVDNRFAPYVLPMVAGSGLLSP